MSQELSSAAVVIGALRVKILKNAADDILGTYPSFNTTGTSPVLLLLEWALVDDEIISRY